MEKLPYKQYRKRPLVVTARKLLVDESIETPEGIMQGKAGDYLVCGIYDELYPMAKAIFEDSYDEVKV